MQFYIKTFTDGGAAHTERCISRFPHPYPSLLDLQVRMAGLGVSSAYPWAGSGVGGEELPSHAMQSLSGWVQLWCVPQLPA